MGQPGPQGEQASRATGGQALTIAPSPEQGPRRPGRMPQPLPSAAGTLWRSQESAPMIERLHSVWGGCVDCGVYVGRSDACQGCRRPCLGRLLHCHSTHASGMRLVCSLPAPERTCCLLFKVCASSETSHTCLGAPQLRPAAGSMAAEAEEVPVPPQVRSKGRRHVPAACMHGGDARSSGAASGGSPPAPPARPSRSPPAATLHTVRSFTSSLLPPLAELQYKAQPLFDFRAAPSVTRGYKVGVTKLGRQGTKRKLDEYSEQVGGPAAGRRGAVGAHPLKSQPLWAL